MALHHPCGVAYEPARSCRPYTGTSPAPGRRLVARPGGACAPADDLLLRRLQPDLMDQAPDPGGARRRVQWLFHCHVGSVIDWKSGAGNGQTALYAPLRRRADDPAHFVQECDLLAMRSDRTASREARPFSRRRRRDSRFSYPASRALLLATLFIDTDLVDGAVPCLRHNT